MQIKREENIFYNLIKNETSLTEVFCNFMKYKIFRDLFIDIVNEKIKNKESTIDKSKVRFEDFDTEVALKKDDEKLGRIDLQLKVNDEIYLFEIKIETFTSLTDNQPKNYLKFLKNDNLYKNENLFFILSKGYFHKNEIYEKWEEKTKYSKKEIENHNVIYWEDILKLFKIVFDTKIDIQSKYDQQDEHYFGYFLNINKYKISENLDIWFGVDYEIWKLKKHPISIQLLPNEEEIIHLENFLKNKIDYSKFIYEDGETILYIPLEKKDFENEDETITEILTDKIEFVINILKDYK